jgi:hypothetical protein
MPYTVNGVGTSFCGASGLVAWGGEADCDGVECLVFLYLPVLPYRAVHTFAWQGDQYRQVPIRWSFSLVARAFLRRWVIGMLAIGVFLAFAAGITMMSEADRKGAAALGIPAALLLGVGAVLWWGLSASDRRRCAIRRLLGQHDHGSSDPATWTAALSDSVKSSRELYGTSTYADAVPQLQSRGEFHRAMWAARLSVLKEDAADGERLTDELLSDPRVLEALDELSRDLTRWAEFLGVREGG